MQRRTFLALAGAGLLAGCSGDSGGSAPTDTPTSTPATTATSTPDPRVNEALDDAYTDLDEATTLIEDELDAAWSEAGNTSLSVAGIETALANADEHLQTAEGYTTDEPAPEVAEAKVYVTFFRQAVEALTTVSDGLDQLTTARSHERSSQYEDAIQEFQAAADTFEQAESELETARETLDAIDETTLGGDVDYAKAQQSTGEIGTVIDGYRRLSEAGVPFARGQSLYEEAGGHYENENWGQAASQFDEAAVDFHDAETRFTAGEDDAVQSLQSVFSSRSCYAERKKEAAEAWTKAARYSQNGEQREASDAEDVAATIMDRTCE